MVGFFCAAILKQGSKYRECSTPIPSALVCVYRGWGEEGEGGLGGLVFFFCRTLLLIYWIVLFCLFFCSFFHIDIVTDL